MEDKVANILLADPDIRDINRLRVIQEGRTYHVDGNVELRTGLTLAEADDIKFRLKAKLLEYPDITDVTLGILEDNGVRDWKA